KYLPRGHDMDAALEQDLVGHVVEKITFNIEDRAQARHARQRLGRERRLTDNVARLREHAIAKSGDVLRVRLDDAVGAAKLGLGGRGKDEVERARLGRA